MYLVGTANGENNSLPIWKKKKTLNSQRWISIWVFKFKNEWGSEQGTKTWITIMSNNYYHHGLAYLYSWLEEVRLLFPFIHGKTKAQRGNAILLVNGKDGIKTHTNLVSE